MSAYSHDAGLTISLIVAAVAGVGYLVAATPRFENEANSDDSAETPLSTLVVSSPFPLAVVIFGATFCLLFAVLNPLLQLGQLNLAELRGQLADGTLVLRLSTVVFVSPLLWKAVAHIKRGKRDDESAAVVPPGSLTDHGLYVRDFTQYGIFVAALFALWLLSTKNAHGIPTVFLAYVFAFFSDDWVIMAEYSRTLRGRLLRSHELRMLAANVLLVIPLAIIAWQQFHWWGVAAWYFAIVPLLMARYALAWKVWLGVSAPA